MNTVNIDTARRERLGRVRDSHEIRVNLIGLEVEKDVPDDATDLMRRAYELCAEEWGPDDRWWNVETRVDGWYGIYQYETVTGDIIEIHDAQRVEMGTLEVAVNRFKDPGFKLLDVYTHEANTDTNCVREGGWYHWQ